MPEVYVDLGANSYPIYIEQHGLTKLGCYLRQIPANSAVLVVTNPVISRNYGETVIRSLTAAGFKVWLEKIPAGEARKTFVWAMRLYDRAIQLGMDRKSLLLALGGGVVGDLAGFVAATYMRGVPFIQVPTTLLAQVDSSVGGKVAVNHPQGKNLIGAFYQPRMVLIDPTTLTTLPKREWLSGLAEVIKYGIIKDAALFSQLATVDISSLRGDAGKMTAVIQRSCTIKGQVVGADEKETGLRIILNYGHTIGHALESATGYLRYTHGEAVAIGMVGAALLARELGWLSEEECGRIETVIARCGLPTYFSGIELSFLEKLLYHDKKKDGAHIRWVLPRRIGAVDIAADVPIEVVRMVLVRLSG